jgi:uncharacterized membrane protein
MSIYFPFQVVEESIDIAAPPAAVFARWTDYRRFPEFMEGVSEVRLVGGKELYWRGEFAGQKREWKSLVTVLIPRRRLAWRSTSLGRHSSRVACVEEAPGGLTRLTVKILLDPREEWARFPTPAQVRRRVRANLQRLKALVEGEVGG